MRLVLYVAPEGAEVLERLVKAPPKWMIRPGHKYVRRWWDPKAGRWRYEYYEPENPGDHRGAKALVQRVAPGVVGVATEYDPRVKDKLKAKRGRWDPDRRVWAFPVQRYLEDVRHDKDFDHVIYELDAAEEIKRHRPWREVAPGVYEEGEAEEGEVGAHLEDIPPIPEGALAKLHPEQVEDAKALLRAWSRRTYDVSPPRGIVLANGTGTGKTYVYAAFIATLADQGHKALVVVPNQALAEQTEEVLRQFALKRGEHYEMATHAALRDQRKRQEIAAWLGRGARNAIVLDEAHRFKNLYGSEKSKQAEGALSLLKDTGAFVVYSTATPFDRPWEAKYMALAGIHRVANPPAQNFDEWVQRYGVRVRQNPWGGKEYAFVGTVKDLARMHEDLVRGGFLLKRLLKPEAPVSYEAPMVDLHPEDAALLAQVRERFKDAKGLVKALGVGLLRAILERAKVRAVIPLIRKELDEGRAVAVFTQYLREKDLDPEAILEALLEDEDGGGSEIRKEFLKRLRGLTLRLDSPVRMLQEAFPDVPSALYTGEQTEAQLRKAKEDFNAGRVRLFIATGAKGGTGLSLHDTQGNRPTTQIIVSMPWTAIELDQMLGRVVRRGLKSDVRILMPSTTAPTERALSAVIAQRLRTLGYAVRGGETAVPEEILAGFEYGLAKLDPGRLEQRLEEIGRGLGAGVSASPESEPVPAPKPPKSAPEPIPLLTLPPALKHDPLQPSLFPEVPMPAPPKPKRGAGGRAKRESRGKPAQPPLLPPDMPLFELAKALGVGPGVRLYLKAEERTIPVSRLKWVDRPKERSEVPASHFLMPKERKFPYRNKDGSINCALLRAAISRAAQHGYTEVERRARALYQRHCRGK